MDRIAVQLKTEGPSGLIAACDSDYKVAENRVFYRHKKSVPKDAFFMASDAIGIST